MPLSRPSGRRPGLDDGTTLPADLVVVGAGAEPATGWLEGCGVRLHGDDRGVVCDATLATGLPGVYAAGDVAHWPNPLFDDDLMRLEHWTNAAEIMKYRRLVARRARWEEALALAGSAAALGP